MYVTVMLIGKFRSCLHGPGLVPIPQSIDHVIPNTLQIAEFCSFFTGGRIQIDISSLQTSLILVFFIQVIGTPSHIPLLCHQIPVKKILCLQINLKTLHDRQLPEQVLLHIIMEHILSLHRMQPHLPAVSRYGNLTGIISLCKVTADGRQIQTAHNFSVRQIIDNQSEIIVEYNNAVIRTTHPRLSCIIKPRTVYPKLRLLGYLCRSRSQLTRFADLFFRIKNCFRFALGNPFVIGKYIVLPRVVIFRIFVQICFTIRPFFQPLFVAICRNFCRHFRIFRRSSGKSAACHTKHKDGRENSRRHSGAVATRKTHDPFFHL